MFRATGNGTAQQTSPRADCIKAEQNLSPLQGAATWRIPQKRKFICAECTMWIVTQFGSEFYGKI